AAALVGMAPEDGVIGRRVCMDAREEDVVAAGEYVLRAVAVMIIDIEDRDALPPRGERGLGADRGVVQVGIAAEVIAAGVVPRRAGEGEGAAFAAEHRRQPRERGLHAPVAGLPGARADRGRGVEAVLPEPRVDARELERAPADDRE